MGLSKLVNWLVLNQTVWNVLQVCTCIRNTKEPHIHGPVFYINTVLMLSYCVIVAHFVETCSLLSVRHRRAHWHAGFWSLHRVHQAAQTRRRVCISSAGIHWSTDTVREAGVCEICEARLHFNIADWTTELCRCEWRVVWSKWRGGS